MSAKKAARVEVAAEILCEQDGTRKGQRMCVVHSAKPACKVAGLEATASAEDSAKLLRKLAEVIKEARRMGCRAMADVHLPQKRGNQGNAVFVHER